MPTKIKKEDKASLCPNCGSDNLAYFRPVYEIYFIGPGQFPTEERSIDISDLDLSDTENVFNLAHFIMCYHCMKKFNLQGKKYLGL
jgi:hypothetical protein